MADPRADQIVPPNRILRAVKPDGTLDFIQLDAAGRLRVAADIVVGDLVNVGINNAEFAGNAGAVNAQTQRVTLGSDDPAVVSLAILDDWDESDRAKVNPIVGQAGIAAGAGVVGATVPRTTLASDDPAVTALQILDDWDATEDAAAPSDGVMNMAESRSGDKTAMTADGDATRLVADEYGKIASAVMEWASRTDRTMEQSPISDHVVGDVLADVTNGEDGTYSYYFDMDTYPLAVIQGDLDGGSGTVTVTWEASAQDDGTAQASAFYTDETFDDFGAASATADFCWKIDTPTGYKFGKVKVVASTGDADDADWTLYLRRLY